MIENINLNEATVTGELHGYMYDALFNAHGVLKKGNQIGYEVVSNNEIKLKDGLICNRGRFIRIVGTESVTIENGTSGVARTDLIVARFTTDGINETHTLKVIKGSAGGSVPSTRSDDIYNGGTVSDLVLYKVNLEGLNIASVEPKFEVIAPLKNETIVNKLVRGDVTKNTYIRFARFVIKSGYMDDPFSIKLLQRNCCAGELAFSFMNVDGTDPDIRTLSVRALTGCNAPMVYAYKSSTGTWDFYIKKQFAYDYTTIHSFIASPRVKNLFAITWLDEEVEELPSGYIAAKLETTAIYRHRGTGISFSNGIGIYKNSRITENSIVLVQRHIPVNANPSDCEGIAFSVNASSGQATIYAPSTINVIISVDIVIINGTDSKG